MFARYSTKKQKLLAMAFTFPYNWNVSEVLHFSSENKNNNKIITKAIHSYMGNYKFSLYYFISFMVQIMTPVCIYKCDINVSSLIIPSYYFAVAHSSGARHGSARQNICSDGKFS